MELTSHDVSLNEFFDKSPRPTKIFEVRYNCSMSSNRRLASFIQKIHDSWTKFNLFYLNTLSEDSYDVQFFLKERVEPTTGSIRFCYNLEMEVAESESRKRDSQARQGR